MKKIIRTFAFAAVAAAAITACNKEIDIANNDLANHLDGQERVFTFAIGDKSHATKSILGSDENGRFVQFDPDDSGPNKGLGSIAPNAQGYSSITPSDGSNPATFSIYTKGVELGNTITVWYPYRTKQTDATAVQLVIPAEQHHKSGNAFDMTAMPMVTKQITVTQDLVDATTNNSNTDYTPLTTINFANMGSLLDFKVFSTKEAYAGEKVKSITFNAKNEAGTADANIGGTFTKNLATIDPDTESTMTISSFTDGVSSIVTMPYADAAIGTAKASALDLYMVIAPGTYSGTIMVKTDVAEYTYPLSAKTFVRSGVKAFGLDLNSANASRVEATVIDYVTLPWSYPSDWTDGTLSATSAELTAIEGVTANGLGSDYTSNAPYQIKLDGTGDYINVKTNAAIGSVSFRVKMIGGGNTSSITVKESVDGNDWTDVQTLTISGSQNDIKTLTTTNAFKTASRFVQFYFTKGSNVGLGGIQISEGDSTVWELSAIHVGTEPTKTSYTVGQTFDPAGMVITADYVDADDNTHTKTDIPITGYTYSPTGALALSNSEITISYTEGGITKTATQTISVSEPSGDTWVETALSDLISSDVFVIVGNDNRAMTNDNGTSSAPAAVSVTVSNGELADEPDDNIKWQVSGNSTNGYTFHPNGDSEKWLYCNTTAASSSNNNMRVGVGDRKLFVLNANNQLETKDTYTKRYLSIYNDADWRGYTSTGNAPTVKFYKYTGTISATVATPTFSVAEGTYTSSQSVVIECSTANATIYYTLDGTTPDDTKSVYNSALTISTTTTVKAIAIKGGVSSEVATATYTITSGTTNTLEFTYGSHSGWTISEGAEDKGTYYLLKNDSYIDSPSFSFQSITSVAVTLRSFGGTQYGPIDIIYGSSKIGSQNEATKNLTEYSISVTSPAAGTGSLRFIGQNTSESNGPGISAITITYVE